MSATAAGPSVEYTFGVEEEYQLVDDASGALRSRAAEVRRADWSGEFAAEFQETMLEVGTPPCAAPDTLRQELARLRVQVGAGAASEGLGIVAAGLHPFSRWEGHRRTADPRYAELEEAFGRIARDVHTFGMHVHVAVPERHDRVAVQNDLRPWLPHLLALSASSPFFEGEDTRFASYRAILTRRWPNAGVPPRFADSAEYWSVAETLVRGGVVRDLHTLYWTVRVHPDYPTVEIRVMDACPRLEDAVTVACLCRALVAAIAEGDLPYPLAGGRSDAAEHELLRVNEWSAARHGLDARLVGFGAEAVSLRDTLPALLERLGPIAAGQGCPTLAADVGTLLERGGGAARMRAAAADGGGLAELVAWLRAESLLGAGMDRRRGQRPEGGGGR